MTKAAKVLIVHTASGAPDAGPGHPLAQALAQLGASVRELPLAAPYDALLDAIADGWMPVACKSPGAAPP
ncbi:MAG: hypothetical protein U1E89_08245 [Burkholderiaceae bacterium]